MWHERIGWACIGAAIALGAVAGLGWWQLGRIGRQWHMVV